MPRGWKGWAVWGVAQVALTLIFKFIAKLAENAMLGWGDDRIADWLGITSATIAPWIIPFVLAGLTLWIYHLIHNRFVIGAPRRAADESKGQKSGQRTNTADFFFETLGQPINNEHWTSLFRVASEARRQNDDTPFGYSLAGLTVHEKIMAFAGKINDAAQLYGTPGGPLPSEAIKERGDKIKFRTNGMQMDSTDANGRPLYRYIHLHTADVQTALAAVALASLWPHRCEHLIFWKLRRVTPQRAGGLLICRPRASTDRCGRPARG